MLDKFIASHLSKPKGFFGRVVSFFMNRQNRRIYEKTINILDVKDGEHILDIGCGNGFVLNMIAQNKSQNKNVKFTGIDISESIINAAKGRNREYISMGIMEFYVQDIGRMDFGDGSFDKVYTINTVYFWEDLDKTMVNISRVLKPKGTFFNTLLPNETLEKFSFTKNGYKKHAKEQLIRAGKEAGFDVEIIPIFNGFANCYVYRKLGDG